MGVRVGIMNYHRLLRAVCEQAVQTWMLSREALSRTLPPLVFSSLHLLPGSIGLPDPRIRLWLFLSDTGAAGPSPALRSTAQPMLSMWTAMQTQPRLIFFPLKGQRKYDFQTRQNLLSFYLEAL